MSDPDASGTPNSTVTTLSLKPGDKVDAFTIVDTIATTGSAVVYKAHDELLDRHVAIKQIILGQEDSDEALRKRIRDEAAIHKRVSTSHPKHLIQFIDAVDDPRGLMLVGEYYPSTSLEDLLQKSDAPLDERQALGIVAASAKGLEAIHAVGVVHRDLKPSNILLGEDGGLKICDFGLSALIESQDSLSLGSVRYMAPELLKSEPADGRADIYSLGIIAYEMLAGRAKFDNAFRNVLRDQRNQAMRWMKWHTNLRVSAPLLDDLLPDMPPHLVQLVARMMDKDQARRVGSAEEIVDAIRRHFTGDGPDVDLSPRRSIDHPGITHATTPGDTAALPTRSKAPLILGVLLLFWLAVGVVLFVINDQKQTALEENRINAANVLIEQGIELYNEGAFEDSLENYRSVLNAWPADSAIAKRAQLGAWKAQGRIAFVAGRYDEAVGYFTDYKEAGGNAATVDTLILEAKDNEAFTQIDRTIQQNITDGEFETARLTLKETREQQWTDGQVARLDELEALLNARRAATQADQLIADARRLAAEGKGDEAIETLAGLSDLPEEGQTLLESLRAEAAFDNAMAEGEAAVRTGNLGQAIDAFRVALALQPNGDLEARIDLLDAQRLSVEAARLFDNGEIEAARTRIVLALEKDPTNVDALRLQNQIDNETEFREIENRGDTALAQGDLDGAITAYEAALALAPDYQSLADKLKRVRVRRNLDQARVAIDAGDTAKGEALLQDTLLIDPENAVAQGMLDNLDTQRRYLALVAQGNDARVVSDFGRARRLYRQAQELIPGQEIDQILEDLTFDQYLFQARQFIADGELASARAMLNQARVIRYTDELGELLAEAEAPGTETPPDNAAE